MGRIGKPVKLLQNHRIIKALNTEENYGEDSAIRAFLIC